MDHALGGPPRLTDVLDGNAGMKAIFSACAGNLLEWFDFFVYAYTSMYFAAAFFPSGDQTSQLLATAGVFAAGFFMRPVGGWLFVEGLAAVDPLRSPA